MSTVDSWAYDQSRPEDERIFPREDRYKHTGSNCTLTKVPGSLTFSVHKDRHSVHCSLLSQEKCTLYVRLISNLIEFAL